MFLKMSRKIGNAISDQDDKTIKIQGRVVVMKKNVLDFTDFNSSSLDRFGDLIGTRVCFQLIGSQHPNPSGNAAFAIIYIAWSLPKTSSSFFILNVFVYLTLPLA